MRVHLLVGIVCAMFAALVPAVCLAQAGAVSDSLSEVFKDFVPSAAAVLPDPKVHLIPEVPGEPIDAVYEFPGHEIDFREPLGVNLQFSDRLSVSPYQVRVASDDNPNGLPPRTGAEVMRIPAAALETFRPFWITARSDGELTATPNNESDRLTITVGAFGADSGKTIYDAEILEPFPEGATEMPLEFDIPPMRFDVIESPGEVGGTQGIVSDYVDLLTTIHVRFISTDDPGVIANLPPADGLVLENFELGGGVGVGLQFRSDVEVPEPASLLLLGVGVAAMALSRRSRRA